MKTNQQWLAEMSKKPTSIEKGTILWFDGKNQVKNFPLTAKQKKQLDELCHEADRKERWYLITQDVIVNKMGENIRMKIEARNE